MFGKFGLEFAINFLADELANIDFFLFGREMKRNISPRNKESYLLFRGKISPNILASKMVADYNNNLISTYAKFWQHRIR